MCVINFNSVAHPEKSTRLHLLLEELSSVLSFCEEEVEVFVPRT